MKAEDMKPEGLSVDFGQLGGKGPVLLRLHIAEHQFAMPIDGAVEFANLILETAERARRALPH